VQGVVAGRALQCPPVPLHLDTPDVPASLSDPEHNEQLRRERVLASPRFIKGAFRNTARVGAGLKHGQALSTMRKFFFEGGRRVPTAPLPAESPLQAWRRPPQSGLRATWLGHSTLLLEIDGVRVLTDPVWGLRASPSQHFGPKRFQPVPVAVAELPPLDAVVISHDHYDHMDHPTILALRELDVPFVTSLGVGQHLQCWGIAPERIVELDWWQSVNVLSADGRHQLQVTAAPSQHFSGRGVQRNGTLWSSLVLRGSRHRVFFSGDTGLTPEYTEIAQRLGPFDLVMLEVGAFHPAWGDIHLGPDNALQALSLLGGGVFLPVHWGTFNLALHDWDQPAERLIELAPSRGVQLLMPKLGVAVEPHQVESVDPWWREISSREVSRPSSPTAVPLQAPID
jgi:L-ascorbate metabolism protein UlaG (beta-lactamase superfamily)